MPYVDLAGLSRFAGKSKDFASSECAGPDMANWQKTPAAGAVSFSPVPEMPIDPVVNFSFTETGPAEGEKGPDNPSTFTGVSQAKVTRCGKNIAPNPKNPTTSGNGITITPQNDGGYKVVGTPSTNNHYNIIPDYSYVIPANTTLTVSLKSSSTSTYIQYQAWTTTSPFFNATAGSSVVITTGNEPVSVLIRLTVINGSGAIDTVVYPQIEVGNMETAFEPYSGADYTIQLGSTYYGGSVDLSAGTMTVTVFHSVFNSPYTIVDAQTDDTYICFQQAVYGDPAHGSNTDANLACNMFSIDGDGEKLFLRGNARTNAVALRILKSRLDVSGAVDPSNPTTQEWIDAFAAWNDAGNTLIEYTYTMQTPITVSLTPTQIYSLSQPDSYAPRINTVYSDQVSVQVGYPKSPQATQNEFTNAIFSLGGNV